MTEIQENQMSFEIDEKASDSKKPLLSIKPPEPEEGRSLVFFRTRELGTKKNPNEETITVYIEDPNKYPGQGTAKLHAPTTVCVNVNMQFAEEIANDRSRLWNDIKGRKGTIISVSDERDTPLLGRTFWIDRRDAGRGKNTKKTKTN